MPKNSGRALLLIITITLYVVLQKSLKTSKNISVGIFLFNILLILNFSNYDYDSNYVMR